MAINQKGANGLVAEYQCAATLNSLLAERGVQVLASQTELESALDAATERVAGELTSEQVSRARNQGRALGTYLHSNLSDSPNLLGLNPEKFSLAAHSVGVVAVGHATNAGNPADLLIRLRSLLPIPSSDPFFRTCSVGQP